MCRCFPRLVRVLLIAAPAAWGSPAGPEFEAVPTFRAADVVPPDLIGHPDYQIDDEVPGDGFMYRYVVRSRFGNFDAEGNGLLRERVREVLALTELERSSRYRATLDAAVRSLIDAGRSPFVLVGDLAARPVDTVTGIPSGVARMFGRYLGSARDAAAAVSGVVSEGDGDGGDASTAAKVSSAALDAGDSLLGVGSAERRWAKRLGVDPYTTNEVLRAAIKAIARYDAAGEFVADLAPVPSLPGPLDDVHDLVWDLSAAELRARNAARLEAAGVERASIDAFYDNGAFSPTRQTEITVALLALRDVDGLRGLLDRLATVETDFGARFMASSLVALAAAHADGATLVSMRPDSLVPVGVRPDGRSVTYLPLDHVFWTEDVARALEAVPAADGGGDAYLTGTLSQRTREALGLRGWRAHARAW